MPDDGPEGSSWQMLRDMYGGAVRTGPGAGAEMTATRAAAADAQCRAVRRPVGCQLAEAGGLGNWAGFGRAPERGQWVCSLASVSGHLQGTGCPLGSWVNAPCSEPHSSPLDAPTGRTAAPRPCPQPAWEPSRSSHSRTLP